MPAITYQELCVAFAQETGINAGTFTSVTSTDVLEQKIARWIRSADLWIQGEYTDWPWLWREAPQGTLAVGDATITKPTDLKWMDYGSLVFNKGTNTFRECEYVPFLQFRQDYERGAKQSTQFPSYFTEVRDRSEPLRLSHLPNDATVTYDFDYYRTAIPLDANADVPAMGDWCEAEDMRLILARAKIMYGASENAPEIQAEGAAEYEDYIHRLVQTCHPENRVERSMGDNQGNQMAVITV